MGAVCGRMEEGEEEQKPEERVLSAGQGMCELLSPSCSRILVVKQSTVSAAGTL